MDSCAPPYPVSIRIWKRTKLEQMGVSHEAVHQDLPLDESAGESAAQSKESGNVADDADGAASESAHQDLPVDKSAGESDAQSKGSGNVADDADGAASDSAQQKGRGRENKGQTSSEAAKHIAKANCLGNELKEGTTKLEQPKSPTKTTNVKPPKSPKKKVAAKPTDTETPKPVKKRPAGQALAYPPTTEKRQRWQRPLARAGTQVRRNNFGTSWEKGFSPLQSLKPTRRRRNGAHERSSRKLSAWL